MLVTAMFSKRFLFKVVISVNGALWERINQPFSAVHSCFLPFLNNLKFVMWQKTMKEVNLLPEDKF